MSVVVTVPGYFAGRGFQPDFLWATGDAAGATVGTAASAEPTGNSVSAERQRDPRTTRTAVSTVTVCRD